MLNLLTQSCFRFATRALLRYPPQLRLALDPLSLRLDGCGLLARTLLCVPFHLRLALNPLSLRLDCCGLLARTLLCVPLHLCLALNALSLRLDCCGLLARTLLCVPLHLCLALNCAVAPPGLLRLAGAHAPSASRFICALALNSAVAPPRLLRLAGAHAPLRPASSVPRAQPAVAPPRRLRLRLAGERGPPPPASSVPRARSAAVPLRPPPPQPPVGVHRLVRLFRVQGAAASASLVSIGTKLTACGLGFCAG